VDKIHVPINSDVDVLSARQQGRALAMRLGFSSADLTLIATAISEIARNIIEYAKSGEMILYLNQEGGKQGIVIIARDQGPGISDVNLAMQDGYSTSRGLGLGLPGARRLMDEFEIVSEIGKGTLITMKKWLR
jgi:serine/threonine-protein kinase RsbT